MFDIISGITKVALSPIRGVSELIDDAQQNNSEAETGLAIMTLGISSLVKGTAKGIKDGADDIFN